MDISGKIGWICLVALIFLAFSDQKAQAQNEYLNYDNHCSGITLEPYMEYSQTENIGRGSSTSGYDDNRGTLGLRLRLKVKTGIGFEIVLEIEIEMELEIELVFEIGIATETESVVDTETRIN